MDKRTFREYAAEYMDFMPVADENSAGEIAQKEWCLKNHLLPYFGDMVLSDITTLRAKAYLAKKKKAGLASKTINNHLTVLRRLLNVAASEFKYIPVAPEIPTLKKVPTRVRFLSADEIARLEEAALHEPWRSMIVVALNTGLRVGELLALEWKAVDLKARRLNVERSLCRTTGEPKEPKNGRFREVPLNDAAHVALSGYLRTGEIVFGKRPRGEHYTYNGAYSALEKLMVEANVGDAGWHTLRHTFASHLVIAGVPLYHVKDLLGHSTLEMTEMYAHLTPEVSTDAVNKLGAAFKPKKPKP